MKNCFIISILFLFFSCILFAQTNSIHVDPFLGNYTLGGRADLVWFNSNTGSGFEIGHGLFSGDNPQHPVQDFQDNSSVISTDGVSGNFLMSTISQQERDEAVLGTMESVGDSLIRVRLYVDQYVDGTWSVVPETIDSLKAKASTVGERMLVRMTSGYFDGGPAKDFAIAYNLPDSTQLITIRIFKLDSITGRPIQITSVRDDTLLASLGTQAFFDITAGDYKGNGLDQLVMGKNNAQISISGSICNVSLSFHAYDFDPMSKQLVPKGFVNNLNLSLPGSLPWGSFIQFYRMAQFVLSSGDFNGDGRAECVCGFANYYNAILPKSMYYYVEPFAVKGESMSFAFNDKNLTLVENTNIYLGTSNSLSNAQMTLAAGDFKRDGKDELVVQGMLYFNIFSMSNTYKLTKITGRGKWSKIGYRSHHSIAIADIDGDTTATTGTNWYPEIVCEDFSRDPRSDLTDESNNTPYIRVYKVNSSNFGIALAGTVTGNYSSAAPPNEMADGGILLGNFRGNAIRMGSPRFQALKSVVEPTIILSAPPVHFDVIGDSTYNICSAYPINGTSDAFSSQLDVVESTGAEVTTETHSSWGISSTLSAGGKFFGAGVSTSLTATYGKDFKNTQSYDSSFTIAQSAMTQWDDLIYATVTDYNIWEYPVLADGAMKGHVLAVIAHPKGSQVFSNNQSGYGNSIILDHEPGNLLSYPDDPTENPDVSGNPIYTGGINIGQASSTDQLTLDFSTAWSKTNETSNSYGFSTKVSVEGWGASLVTEGNYNHGEISTHTTTFSKNIEMVMNIGRVTSPTEAYTVTPYVYWSVNGPLVLDYAVDFPPTGGVTSFWTENYSQKPDLTFNCYYQNFAQKGFADLPQQMADWTKEIQIFPSTPEEGDTVNVLAEIHNYSLKATPSTSGVQVRFYLSSSDTGGIPVVDLSGDSVFTTLPVAERGSQMINFKWKIPSGLTSSDSVLYGVIDPGNQIAELKKNNNKGWNSITILGTIPTAVCNPINVVTSFRLFQNYPNPFNPVTRINYQIPKFSHVTIKVYNILGQEIATLVDEQKNAGHYSVEFNASNFASGIYFYRMQAGDFVSTKKLILLK